MWMILADMLGSAGAHGGSLDVQTVGIPDVLGLKLAGDLLHRGALLLAFFDELVINIGDVGDIVDLVAAVFQIAAQRIKDDHRARIADVDIVVNRRAADIDAVLALLLGGQIPLFWRVRVLKICIACTFLPLYRDAFIIANARRGCKGIQPLFAICTASSSQTALKL